MMTICPVADQFRAMARDPDHVSCDGAAAAMLLYLMNFEGFPRDEMQRTMFLLFAAEFAENP